MTTLLPIFHASVLYEIRYNGTFILNIKRFFPDGTMREVGFNNLPVEVKDKVINHIKRNVEKSKEPSEGKKN